jgi:serine/threonine-protein kinase RsbW
MLDHLQRHSLDPLAVRRAREVVDGFLEQAAGLGTLAWVGLHWEEPTAYLEAFGCTPDDLDIGRLGGIGIGDGALAAHEILETLPEIFQSGQMIRTELPVTRPREADVDPIPIRLPEAVGPSAFAGTVAAAMAELTGRGRSPLEAAASSGAAFAARSGSPGGSEPRSAREVATAFVEFEREAGGDFRIVESSEDRVVVCNKRCPFGPGVTGIPELCRSTSALLGSLAARTLGESTVVVEESSATGDPQCRLVLTKGTASRPSRDVGHTYVWPPGGAELKLDELRTSGELARGFRVALSLQLPRDRLSVPIVRHLARQMLAEVGVVEEQSGDVQLAVTEACANVVEHSGPGDAYEVTVTVGPALCEIRVVDIGRGFDHESLNESMAAPSAERGRGVALMDALMDQVLFESRPERGTVVHLVKRLRFDDGSPARRLMLDALDSLDSRDHPGSGGSDPTNGPG